MRAWIVPIVVLVLIAIYVIASIRPKPEVGLDLPTWAATIHAETQAEYERDPTADSIRGKILPRYAQAHVFVLTCNVGNSEKKRRQQELAMMYVNRMLDGWEFAAMGLEQHSDLFEARAEEQFTQARQLLRELGAEVQEPVRGIREEIDDLLLAEVRLDESMAITTFFPRPESELADRVESFTLRNWKQAVARFTAVTSNPPEEDALVVSRLVEYAELRTEAIELQVEAWREGDDAKATQAAEVFSAAEELRTILIEEGLEVMTP